MGRIAACCGHWSMAYAAIGVEHPLVAPQDRNVDDWEKVTEGVGALAA
jgi:hypothetical protein